MLKYVILLLSNVLLNNMTFKNKCFNSKQRVLVYYLGLDIVLCMTVKKKELYNFLCINILLLLVKIMGKSSVIRLISKNRLLDIIICYLVKFIRIIKFGPFL